MYLCCGVFVLSLFFTVHSCRKDIHAIRNERRLVPLGSGSKTANQYLMICAMGHNGTNCPGCMTINGKRVHIDCQGEGTACLKSSRVSLQYNMDSSLTVSTLDTFGLTDLDFLNMPAMSLSLEVGEGVYSYLNIPAQLVYRDTATQQFTFTGLSFSERALY